MGSQNFKMKGPLWPPTLNLPARPPKLIYIDLNHWIELSKAHSGHQDGDKHRHILDACLEAAGDGRAVFPLSEYIYSEISKIKSYRQRQNLRNVMEQISQYKVLASLTDVVTHEIEAVLDHMVAPNPTPINAMNYLNWGVHGAFGLAGDIRVRTFDGHDVTDEVRINHPLGPEAFDGELLKARLELNRKVIEGPNPQEEPDMRAEGWAPENVEQAFEEKASDEQAQVRRFNEESKWRRGRISDVIQARELIFEIGDIFTRGFASRGVGVADQFAGSTRDDIRTIFVAMPSSNVAVELKTSLHRDPNHRWTNNDIYDIRALSLTIPYCDVVVTDNAMRSHINRLKLPERYDTVVISQLSELLDHLVHQT